MDKKGIVLLLVALILAIVAGGGVYVYLKGMLVSRDRAPLTVPVVVAVKDMTFGTTLNDRQLKVVQFPKESVPMGSYSTIDSILGQTTKVFVVTGEPLLASKLSSIGGGLSVRVPPNMRAMSLKVNEVTGVSGFILPGDRVDLLVTMDNARGRGVTVTKTFLQDLEVLAAGVKTETKNNHNITVQSVTLLVDPQGAEKIALAVSKGRIHLALRNPVDHEFVDVKSTDTKTVLGMTKPRKAARRRTTPRRPRKVVATKKPPVKVGPDSFTVIRNGKILNQKSPTADRDEKDSNKK